MSQLQSDKQFKNNSVDFSSFCFSCKKVRSQMKKNTNCVPAILRDGHPIARPSHSSHNTSRRPLENTPRFTPSAPSISDTDNALYTVLTTQQYIALIKKIIDSIASTKTFAIDLVIDGELSSSSLSILVDEHATKKLIKLALDYYPKKLAPEDTLWTVKVGANNSLLTIEFYIQKTIRNSTDRIDGDTKTGDSSTTNLVDTFTRDYGIERKVISSETRRMTIVYTSARLGEQINGKERSGGRILIIGNGNLPTETKNIFEKVGADTTTSTPFLIQENLGEIGTEASLILVEIDNDLDSLKRTIESLNKTSKRQIIIVGISSNAITCDDQLNRLHDNYGIAEVVQHPISLAKALRLDNAKSISHPASYITSKIIRT